MVQRKVPNSNKLGIQADHVKYDKLLANLKPSSSQSYDGKNRGADLKKKMKKSRSLRLSDIERLTSSPIRRTTTQLGKPLALDVPATAAVAKKQQPVFKASDGSPNYMKSTSCFDARKEKSQVSLRNAQTSPGRKNLNRRSCSHSKHGSGSGNKPERSLTRTSSLKLVRTLTKTPSFKPARASAKKSSRVVLCEDIDAQRSTCSSTQKDSKFPAYLMLSPGATESEGTSVRKVCPYTYCSLNGHRHSHLPPLKCFLSARRRLVKTQKSMKMEALTPRRAKRSSEGTEEIETPKLIVDDKPALVESDIVNLAKPHLLQDGGQDFFIEIYTKCKDTDSEAMGKGTYGEKEDTIDAAVEVEDQNDSMSSIDWGDEAMAGHMGSQGVAESVSDQSAKSEVEFAETLDQYGDVATPEIDTVERFPGEQVEDANRDFLPILAQEKKTMGSFCTGSNFEGEWIGSEAIDMEWEEEHLTASEMTSEADYSVRTDSEFDGEFGCPLQNNRLDSEADYSFRTDNGFDEEFGCHLEKNHDFNDEYVIMSDDIVSSCNEVIMDDVQEELFEEESACSELRSDDVDSELNGFQNSNFQESSQASESLNCNQLSSTKDTFEDSKTAAEENQQPETTLIRTEIPSASMEESVVEPRATSKDSQEKNRVFEAENLILASDPQFGDDETNGTHKAMDEASNDKEMHTTNQHDGDGMEETKQADDAKILGGIQASDFSWCYSEADQVGTEVKDNKYEKTTLACQPDNTAEKLDSGEEIDDDSSTDETQNDLSHGCYESSRVFVDQNLEKQTSEAKNSNISSSMDDEGHSNPTMNESTLSEVNTEEVEKVEVEDNTELDAADILAIANGKTGPETAGSSQKWASRCKRRIEDEEDLKKFNPREPNYLPLVPDPDSEKVDLRHQMMDERKNAEEWMLDYHLQKAVTKLAPARKRKVALLVEAFETVLPTSKCETNSRSTTFAHGRPMQACS